MQRTFWNIFCHSISVVGWLLLFLLLGQDSSCFVITPATSTQQRRPIWYRPTTKTTVLRKNDHRLKETANNDDDPLVPDPDTAPHLLPQPVVSNARLSILESDFPGAGIPRPDLDPSEIPPLLMMALQNNDFPTVDEGLHSMWEFASDTTKFIFCNNRTEFITSAHQTAQEFPTSFYGAAMKGQSWSMETELNRVGGANGWIATQVMKTICSDGRLRRWQWELRKQRRPPNLNCWYVESIGSSDRKGQFEPE